jgi:hypothetical protein
VQQLRDRIEMMPARIMEEPIRPQYDKDKVPLEQFRLSKFPNKDFRRSALPPEFQGRILRNNVDAIADWIEDKFLEVQRQVSYAVNMYNIVFISQENNRYTEFVYTSDTDELLRLMRVRLKEWAEFYDNNINMPLLLSAIDIAVIVNTEVIIRETQHAISTGNEKYYIVDTPTHLNCVWVSIYTCMKWEKNKSYLTSKDKRIEGGRKFKANYKKFEFYDITTNNMKDLARILNIKINLYNELFEKTAEYDYGKQEVNLLIDYNHAKALIVKEKILKVYKDFEFPTIEYHAGHIEKIIVKKIAATELDKKIASFDIETFLETKEKEKRLGSDKRFIAYASSLAYKVDGEIQTHTIYGREDNLIKLFDYIFKNIEIFKDFTFYSHYGGKFDMVLLMHDVLLSNKEVNITDKRFIELNGAIIGMTIRYKGCTINFRDSFRIFQSSLRKICIDLKVDNQKGELDHNAINNENYMSKKEEVLKYLHNDVVGLYQCLDLIGDMIHNEYKINIQACFTSASLSKNVYYKNYYWKCKPRLYNLSLENDRFIREAYTGGRNEVFHLGSIKRVGYLDVTSLYPSVGCYLLPCGKPEPENIQKGTSMRKVIEKLEKDSRHAFIECMVKGTKKDLKNIKPLHGFKTNGRLVFQYYKKPVKMVLYSEEIRHGMNFGYKYTPIKMIKFERKNFLKEFFEDSFNNKAKAQEEGNFALAYMFKIMINSGYGFWGFNPYNKDVVKLFKGDTGLRIALAKGGYKDHKEVNGYNFCKMSNKDMPNDTNAAIAAAITSYAKITLHQLICDIESKGHKVYYCDTDSVMTSIRLSDYPDLIQKWRPDKKGKILGSLKNELGLDADGNDLMLDEVIIGGCKMYTIIHEGKPWSTKIKGMKKYHMDGNKISEEEMSGYVTSIIDGKTVVQQQSQILFNRNDMIADEPFNLRQTNDIVKNFKFIYTKGIVTDDGEVEPFTV